MSQGPQRITKATLLEDKKPHRRTQRGQQLSLSSRLVWEMSVELRPKEQNPSEQISLLATVF